MSTVYLTILPIARGRIVRFIYFPRVLQPSRLELYNTPTVSLKWDKTRPNKSPGYYIKQSYGEAPALEICEMWSTLSLPLLPGSL